MINANSHHSNDRTTLKQRMIQLFCALCLADINHVGSLSTKCIESEVDALLFYHCFSDFYK